MSNDVVISVQNLSKRYRIGAKEEGYKTFREAIIDGFKAPFRNFRRLRNLTKFDDGSSKEEVAGSRESNPIACPVEREAVPRGHSSPCPPLHAPRSMLHALI